MSTKIKKLIQLIDAGLERCKLGIEENENGIEEIKIMLAKTKILIDKCEENISDNYMGRTTCNYCQKELSSAEAQYIRKTPFCKDCIDLFIY